jgi:hypothetical protein
VALRVQDSFTAADSTALTSHTGEVGASWSLHPHYEYSQAFFITGNRAWSSAGLALASGASSSPYYSVSADLVAQTTFGSGSFGLVGRYDVALNTGYLVRTNGGNWTLFQVLGDTAYVSLGSYSETVSAGMTRHVELRFVEEGEVVEVWIDDELRITGDATTYVRAGYGGIRSFDASSSQGIHFDNFEIVDDAGSTVTIDFEGAAGAPAGWTNRFSSNAVQDGSGVLRAQSTGANAFATYDAADGASEMDVSVVIASTDDYAGVILRASGSNGTFQAYAVSPNLGDTATPINAWSGGGYQGAIYTAGNVAWAAGDTLRVTCSADANPIITIYRNGVQIGQHTATSGYAGTAWGVELFNYGANTAGIESATFVIAGAEPEEPTLHTEQVGGSLSSSGGLQREATYAGGGSLAIAALLAVVVTTRLSRSVQGSGAAAAAGIRSLSRTLTTSASRTWAVTSAIAGVLAPSGAVGYVGSTLHQLARTLGLAGAAAGEQIERPVHTPSATVSRLSQRVQLLLRR